MPLAVAHGVILSGMIPNRIFHLWAKLIEFKGEIALIVVVEQCLVLAPLLLFTARLAHAKRAGRRQYRSLAERYVRAFDAKWLADGAPPDEELLGSATFQSLADVSTSFQVVRSMRMRAVSKDAILQVAIATLLPVAPLLLTIMPMEVLLKKLFEILFK